MKAAIFFDRISFALLVIGMLSIVQAKGWCAAPSMADALELFAVSLVCMVISVWKEEAAKHTSTVQQ